MCASAARAAEGSFGAGSGVSEVGAKRGKRPGNYYEREGESRLERLDWRRAEKMEGLGDEITMIRWALKRSLNAAPRTKKAHKDLRRATDGVETLVKAVTAQHRMSPRTHEGLASDIARVLEAFGDQILPADR